MGLRRGGVRGRGGPGRGALGRGAMGRGGIGGRGRGMIGWGREGFGGRGRGRGRGRGALTRPVLTKEQLDNQLDAYMSKTKGICRWVGNLCKPNLPLTSASTPAPGTWPRLAQTSSAQTRSSSVGAESGEGKAVGGSRCPELPQTLVFQYGLEEMSGDI